MNKKVLIYSLSTGTGHNLIAQKIEKQFKEKNYIVKIVDFFENNFFRNLIINKNFNITTNYFLSLYNFTYKQIKNSKNNIKNFVSKLINVNKFKNIKKEIENFNPDIVICTHIFPSLIVDKIKKENPTFQFFAFITDFYPHPFWEQIENTDKIFILHQSKQIVENLHMFENFKVETYNLYKFKQNRNKIARNLKDNTLHILFLTKNVNRAKIEQNLKKFKYVNKKVQIIIICGGNKRLYNVYTNIKREIENDNIKICVLKNNNLKMKNILFNWADIVVSKGGINLIFETLSNYCLFFPIYKTTYNEKQNIKFLQENGIAFPLLNNNLKDFVNEKIDEQFIKRTRIKIDKFLNNVNY